MEGEDQQSTDGSSIKPVSSLRSHFEQMTGSKPASPLPNPRNISPGPKPRLLETSNSYDSRRSLDIPRQNGSASPAGQAQNAFPAPALRQQTTGSMPRNSYSPFSNFRRPSQQVDPSPPSVIVEPPKSPPKGRNSPFTSPSQFLVAEIPRGPTPPGAPVSPSNSNIQSRANTHSAEPRKVAPEPPPPRRSGELKRDPSPQGAKRPPPPPVNRAEKPKLPPTYNQGPKKMQDSLVLTLSNEKNEKQPSPFSTPPSGDDTAEDYDSPRRPSAAGGRASKISSMKLNFDPPPVQHSVVSKRRDEREESHATPRRSIAVSPSDFPDEKPPLPTRSYTAGLSGIAPPPRPSVEQSRPAMQVNTVARSNTVIRSPNTSEYATPTRRNVSTPISQGQPPVRTHRKSVTVDETPYEHRYEYESPAIATARDERAPRELPAPRQAPAQPPTQAPAELPSKVADHYPDSSYSSRRAPHLRKAANEIDTKYDTRLVDICGEFVCCSGYYTRVWSLVDGGLLVSLAHGDTIKILSMAFKPTDDVSKDENRLWLGNNIGEILEVDIASGTAVASSTSAHTRREIIKIYRHGSEMWTLDDSGTFHVWASGDGRPPSLDNPAQSFRIPKGHTFSIVVGDELWHAAGKDIRIFRPSLNGDTQFQVLQRPICQPGAGEVTAAAVIPSQPDRIYIGHTDGKVSIYSLGGDYACLGIVNVSVYKINTLAAVGDYLWAGYSTGMIYVYDTTKSPWVVKKDWDAHYHKPVVRIVVDSSSFWKYEGMHVISLGADNIIHAWDGLLQDDFLETEMQARESSYCNFEQIRTLVMTWNAGASTPGSLRYAKDDSTFFPSLLQNSDSPDIIVFGFQELVDLEDKKTIAKSFFSKSKSKKKDASSEQAHMSHQYRDWRDFLTRCLDDYMPGSELYQLLHTANLVGLFTCIFVKAKLRQRITEVSAAEVKRGMDGRAGNKGALCLRFLLDDTSICFINCHLAAGQTHTMQRNNDVAAILESDIFPAEQDRNAQINSFVGGGDGSMILDHELCILNGDLNYRIDTMSRDAVVNAVKVNNLAKLLERDQLLVSRRKNPGFRLRAFKELPITFAPTYKYDVGTDTYDTSDKKRAPAWCDRLLSRGGNRIRQVTYQRHEVRVSDHRPVTGLFDMTIKHISPRERAMVWEECKQRFEEVKDELAVRSKLDYLTKDCGLDAHQSQQLVAKTRRPR